MRKLAASLGIALWLGSAAAGVHASGGAPMGGGMGSSTGAGRERSPEEAAQGSYNRGLKKRDNALEHERAAGQAGADEKRQSRELAKARKDWEAAVQEFKKATEKKADFYQAYSDLGYSYRKLGSYEQSLAAYDEALRLNPSYPEAIEYLGEAYLGLNRIEPAKGAYMKLFAIDRPLAAKLMDAFGEWAERSQASPPQGVDPQALEAFRGWVRERRELAAQAGGGSPSSRPW